MTEDAARLGIRSALQGVPAYVPGKPAPEVEGVTSYKLSSNENPYPPLPGVLEATTAAAARMNRYPDMASAELVEALAERIGVTAEEVVVGTGSSGILSQVISAMCESGDSVVYAWRSFEAYPIMVAVSGASSIQVPLTEDGRHDLPAMAAAVAPSTSVVIVCTPNNPTGPVVHTDEVEDFLARVPQDVLVVIDEAYVEFVRDPQVLDALAIYRRHPNVMVMRTFSKAYGLAGLRVGYAIARPQLAEALRKTAIPFGVNLVAQSAAMASLAAEPALRERVDALVAERTRVVDALREQGWPVPDAQGNFCWLPLGALSAEFAEVAQGAGLTVRAFAGDGVRVTIGESEANDRLVAVAQDYLNARRARARSAR